MKPKILGVVGSLQKESFTRQAVQYLLEQSKILGAEIQIVDLLNNPLPIFNPDERNHSEYLKIREKVSWANGIILGSPDYHGSMSGAMKNFLDYFWKEFAGKLFGYVCASHEKGLTAMDQMRTSVRQCYGWSLPYGISITKEDFDSPTGSVKNPKMKQRLDLMAYDLCTYASLFAKQFESDLKSNNPQAGFACHYR
jgi:NAD(P)H-dependent FMN reductase